MESDVITLESWKIHTSKSFRNSLLQLYRCKPMIQRRKQSLVKDSPIHARRDSGIYRGAQGQSRRHKRRSLVL